MPVERAEQPSSELRPGALRIEVVDAAHVRGRPELVPDLLPVPVEVQPERAVCRGGLDAADDEARRAGDVEVDGVGTVRHAELGTRAAQGGDGRADHGGDLVGRAGEASRAMPSCRPATPGDNDARS